MLAHDSHENLKLLKADRPHPHNYPHTPTDYGHTDKHLRLVMAPIALNCSRESVRRRTDGQMDGRTDGRTDATKYIISLASRSIKMGSCLQKWKWNKVT